MVYTTHIGRLLLLVLLFVTVFTPVHFAQLAETQPVSLSCPSGDTVWLEGQAPPAQPLLVYLRRRAVGGGVSDNRGRWRLPLRVTERPGIYNIEVRLRSDQTIVGRFTCYVDTPIDQTPSPTPTSRQSTATTPLPTSTISRASPTRVTPTTPTLSPSPTVTDLPGGRATSTPSRGGTVASPTSSASATATATGSATTTATGTATSATSVVEGPPTSTTASPTATPTVTPSRTATPNPAQSAVRIDDVDAGNPTSDPPDWGYVIVSNTSPTENIDLTGWVLKNLSRTVPQFTFPTFTLASDSSVVVWTDDADQNSDDELFWGANQQVWQRGDIVVLLNRTGQEMHRCTVGTRCR